MLGRGRVGFRRRERLREIQRVLHVARRMLHRHVERFEVVVVVLDLRPFEHLVSEACEDLLHLLAQQAERMAMPEHRRAAGQRDVHGAGGAPRRGERRLALGDGGLDGLLELVGEPSQRPLRVGRRLGKALHVGSDPAPFASDPPRAQRLQVRVRAHRGQFVLKDEEGAIGSD